MTTFHLEKATDGKHKYIAVFEDQEKTKHVPFGAKGYEDYTMHKNPLRQQNYLRRHRTNEDWSNYMSAGSLSRYILWETPSLQKNIQLFKKRFNLQ
jgi:hypothetical protein